jgi:hypothetical protein
LLSPQNIKCCLQNTFNQTALSVSTERFPYQSPLSATFSTSTV